MTPAIGRTVRGLAYGLILWFAGFLAGMLAFAVPALRNLAPIPGVTVNPAISVLALVTWLVVTPIVAARYLAGQADPVREGLRMGLLAVIINLALDYAVLGAAMGNGPSFFGYASIWVGYAVLLVVPVIVARRTVAPETRVR